MAGLTDEKNIEGVVVTLVVVSVEFASRSGVAAHRAERRFEKYGGCNALTCFNVSDDALTPFGGFPDCRLGKLTFRVVAEELLDPFVLLEFLLRCFCCFPPGQLPLEALLPLPLAIFIGVGVVACTLCCLDAGFAPGT